MKLPIVGGAPSTPTGSRRPGRPATRKPIPMQKLMDLLMELEEVAQDDTLSVEAIEDCALDQGGVPRANMYAAAVLNPELKFESDADVTFVVCTGGCQEWGALERVEQLLLAREDRAANGGKSIAVHAKPCLDKCEYAPVVKVVTPNGTAVVSQADEEKIAEALAMVDSGAI